MATIRRQDTFTRSVLLRAAGGAERGAFESWSLRGDFPIKRTVDGSWRQFGLLDAVRLKVIVDLTRLGLTISSSSHVASFIRAEDLSRPECTLLVCPPSSAGLVRRKVPQVAFSTDGDRPQGTVISINFPALVAEVREAIEAAVTNDEELEPELLEAS